MESMHDWTLLNIVFEWAIARATFSLREHGSVYRTLVAEEVTELKIPRDNAWGPSVSVNGTSEVALADTGNCRLSIEMQTGDVIEVVAGKFTLT